MKLRTILAGVALGAAAPLLLAQSTTTETQTTTQTTIASPAGQETTVTGEVVRYDAGQTLVVRQADGRTATYTIGPDATVPAEVQVGKTVTISTRADDSGTVKVTRVVIATSPSAYDSSRTGSVGGTSTTTTNPALSNEAPASGAMTVSGEVVRYEAGKTIVVRQASGKETSYTLTESSQVPGEIRVGRRVTLTTQPSDSGMLLVTRVTTESTLPDGRKKTTTESTYSKASGETAAAPAASVAGTVSAYQPGQSITITLPDKSTATYAIDTESQLPSDVAVGKQVTIQTRTVTTSSSPVVRRVVYTTKTKTTKKTASQ